MVRIGDVIVPPLADRDALEQIVATIERLAELQQVGFALQLDTKLAPHRAGAAVAAGEIVAFDLLDAGFRFNLSPYTAGVLVERDELAGIAHRHAWHGFGDRL